MSDADVEQVVKGFGVRFSYRTHGGAVNEFVHSSQWLDKRQWPGSRAWTRLFQLTRAVQSDSRCPRTIVVRRVALGYRYRQVDCQWSQCAFIHADGHCSLARSDNWAMIS